MKTYTEKLMGLSQEISKDNVQKSWKTAKTLTRPSKATHFGSLIGTTIGAGLLCGGLIGTLSGRSIIGIGGLAAGAVTIVSNIINLKKKK